MLPLAKLLPLLLLGACSTEVTSVSYPMTDPGPTLPADQRMVADGTIRFVNVEGGCWALATAAGYYEPAGLPPTLRRDGQNVRAWYHAATDLGSICMIAPIVHIDSAVAR
jgi:hypothetical protein